MPCGRIKHIPTYYYEIITVFPKGVEYTKPRRIAERYAACCPHCVGSLTYLINTIVRILTRNETTHHHRIPILTPHSSDSQEWRATAERLNPYSHHRFRVRAVNDIGPGEWSTASDWVRTGGTLSSPGDHDNVQTDATAVPGNKKSCCRGSSGFDINRGKRCPP